MSLLAQLPVRYWMGSDSDYEFYSYHLFKRLLENSADPSQTIYYALVKIFEEKDHDKLIKILQTVIIDNYPQYLKTFKISLLLI